MSKERTIASIDIGNYKIRTAIGVLTQDKKVPSVVGVGVSPSTGMRRGQVIDVEEAINNITASLEEAERMAGEPINHVFIGIGGHHIDAVEAKGVIATQGEEIIESDVARVLETAQAISIPSNKQVIKIIPKFFSIDNQKGVRYPVGMIGRKLEVEAHIISGQSATIKNIEKCVHEAGVDIDDIVPNTLAASEAVLSKRQRELGVVVIDIGHGSTSMAVYEEGSLIHTAVLPLGGENVTNDIAIGARTSLDMAEKLKTEYGTCAIKEVDPKQSINMKDLGGTDEKIERSYIAQIVEARYYEILIMARNELRKIRREGMLPAGVVFTGGGCKCHGLLDLARDILSLPVQIGFPHETSSVIEQVDDPSFATCVGLLVWGARMEPAKYGFNFSIKNFDAVKGAFGKAKNMFTKLLP